MPREKTLDNKVKTFLRARGSWNLKYWAGGGFTKSGIPDILACVDGYFFGIEDKRDDGNPSMLQIQNLKKIRKSGGYGILLFAKDFNNFKVFVNTGCDKSDPWYLDNIELQQEWERKLE